MFISHAWKYNFLDLVDILLDHFKDKPDTVVWFDLFSNNQHKASALNYDWWATTFRTAIKEFGYTVMVLMPWDDPIPLKRAWCLWELFCTYDTTCKFEVAMGQRGYNEFIQAMESTGKSSAEVMNSMLANIDVQNSQAFKPEDRAMIHDTVKKQVNGGFSQLNAVVLTLMRNWVIQVANKEMNKRLTTKGDSHPDTLLSVSNLAGLYDSQGKYDLAEPLFVQCLEKSRAVLGDSHPNTLASVNNLNGIYRAQGKHDKIVSLS